MNKITENIKLTDLSIVNSMGMGKDILEFAKHSENITNSFNYELNLIGVNNKILSGSIIKLLKSGKIELRYSDKIKLPLSSMFIPINAEKISTMKVLIDISSFVAPSKDVGTSGVISKFKFKDTIQILYSILLQAITVYADVHNKILGKILPYGIREGALKVHDDLMLTVFNFIKYIPNIDHQIYLGILISVYGRVTLTHTNIKSNADVEYIMTQASARIINNNFKNVNISSEVKAKALVMILERYYNDDVYNMIVSKNLEDLIKNIAYVIPEFRNIKFKEYIFKYINTFGVVNTLSIEYMPYILGTMVTCKEQFALHSNKLLYGTINDTSKLIFDELVKYVANTLHNVR